MAITEYNVGLSDLNTLSQALVSSHLFNYASIDRENNIIKCYRENVLILEIRPYDESLTLASVIYYYGEKSVSVSGTNSEPYITLQKVFVCSNGLALGSEYDYYIFLGKTTEIDTDTEGVGVVYTTPYTSYAYYSISPHYYNDEPQRISTNNQRIPITILTNCYVTSGTDVFNNLYMYTASPHGFDNYSGRILFNGREGFANSYIVLLEEDS